MLLLEDYRAFKFADVQNAPKDGQSNHVTV